MSMQVNLRLSDEELTEIDALIENGDFANRTEFIKYAIRKTLRAYNGRGGGTSSKMIGGAGLSDAPKWGPRLVLMPAENV